MRRFLIFVVLCVGSGWDARTARGQALQTADSTLREVLQNAAAQVLNDCGAWPPKLVNSTKPKDRAKEAKEISDSGRAEELLKRFAAALQFTDQEVGAKPHIYRGSLLRLLDSAGVFDPVIPNSKLLGIATTVDPAQLNLWGVDRFTVKHNCSSLLAMSGQAQAGFAIPLFALDAAFQASLKGQSEKVIVLTTGSFESPFAKYYSPQADRSQQIFASFRALNRRLTMTDGETETYIAAARLLTINKDLAVTEQNSIIGDVKANIKFPFLNASGTVSAQMLNSFQQSSASYLTFSWGEKFATLPSFKDAVDTINTRLETFEVNTETVAVGSEVEAFANAVGWPPEFCDQSWKVGASGSYTPGKFSLEQMPVSQSGIPGCRIRLAFGLSGPVTDSVQAANPDLTLIRVDGAGAPLAEVPPIHLRLKTALHPAGKPVPVLESNSPRWDSWPSTANKQALKWTISGRVDLKQPNRVVFYKRINRETLKCAIQDGTSVQLDDVRFETTGTPYDDPSVGPTFSLVALLATNAGKAYEEDYTAYARRTDRRACSLTLTMAVKTRNADGSAEQEDTVSIQPLAFIDIPNELPLVPPAPDDLKITAGDGMLTLSFNPAARASAYKIYRIQDGNASTETQLASNYVLTTFEDKNVQNGTQYSYRVVAVNVSGEGPTTTYISGRPVAPVTGRLPNN